MRSFVVDSFPGGTMIHERKFETTEAQQAHRAQRKLLCALCALCAFLFSGVSAQSQEKIRIAYSSTDTLNQIWTIANDAGFYKKYGLDVDLVYIGSTTVGITAIMAQDVQVGNAAGSGVANANVRGADTVSVACTINVLAYELVVLDSIKSAEDLKGKSIGISRFGSAGTAKRTWLETWRRRQDPSGGRRFGAGSRIQPRSYCRIPVTTGERQSNSGRATPSHLGRHGRSPQALPAAFHLRRDHEELPRKEARHRKESCDVVDRRVALLQDSKGRKPKNHRQISARREQSLSGYFLSIDGQDTRARPLYDARRDENTARRGIEAESGKQSNRGQFDRRQHCAGA